MGLKMLLLKNLANSSSLNTTWRETKGKWRCFFLTLFLLACFLCFFLPLFFGGSFSFCCKSHLGFPYTVHKGKGEKTIDNPATLKKLADQTWFRLSTHTRFSHVHFFSTRENYSCFFSVTRKDPFSSYNKKLEFHKGNERKRGEIKV